MFRAIKTEWDDSNPDMEIRTVIQAELIEVAPVTFPAYPQSETGVESARSVLDSHKHELEAMKREKEAWKIPILRKKLDIMTNF
jgi:phage head maturation protease